MRAVVLASLALLALTACGGGGGKTAAAAPPASGPASTAASPAPAGPAAIGQTRQLDDPQGTVKATVYAYRTLRSQFPPDRKGYVFAGADVKVCVPKVTAPTKKISLSWAPWSVAYADSTTIEPVSSWSDDWFTVPLYSGFGKTVREGGCLRGWVLFEVPKGKKPVTVIYAPGENSPLEWRVS